MTNDEAQSVFREDTSELRPSDYYLHFKEAKDKSNLLETKGIKHISLLNDLEYFSVADSIPHDPLHDLDEGVSKYVVRFGLHQFVKKKLISKDAIVARAKQFSYGYLDAHHQPRCFKTDFKSLKLGGLEVRNFLLRFMFIYGDLENEDTKDVFSCIRSLIYITKVVFSPEVDEKMIRRLDDEVENLLRTWKIKLKQKIFPKMHNLIHYGSGMRRLGPYIFLDTSCYESQHHSFNLLAKKFTNFSNLPFYLAKKRQQYFAETWSNEFDPNLTKIKEKSNKRFSTNENFGEGSREVASVEATFEFRPGFYVYKFDSDTKAYTFYQIKLLEQTKEDETKLHCTKVETLFDESLLCYEIIRQETASDLEEEEDDDESDFSPDESEYDEEQEETENDEEILTIFDLKEFKQAFESITSSKTLKEYIFIKHLLIH